MRRGRSARFCLVTNGQSARVKRITAERLLPGFPLHSLADRSFVADSVFPIEYKNKRALQPLGFKALAGADTRIRTGDLILTKDALYLLSYISMLSRDNGHIIAQRIAKIKRVSHYFFNKLCRFVKLNEQCSQRTFLKARAGVTGAWDGSCSAFGEQLSCAGSPLRNKCFAPGEQPEFGIENTCQWRYAGSASAPGLRCSAGARRHHHVDPDALAWIPH